MGVKEEAPETGGLGASSVPWGNHDGGGKPHHWRLGSNPDNRFNPPGPKKKPDRGWYRSGFSEQAFQRALTWALGPEERRINANAGSFVELVSNRDESMSPDPDLPRRGHGGYR